MDLKIRDLQVGSWIDIYKFIKRDALAGVTSGRLTKTDGGYTISLVRNGATHAYPYVGENLDRDGLYKILRHMGGDVAPENVIDASTKYTVSAQQARAPEVNVAGRRQLYKPTDSVNSAVVEQSGGFTTTGTNTIRNVAGNPVGEHWVLSSWTPVEFSNYNLSQEDRQFLHDNTAAVAFKSQPGSKPEINYFATEQLARDELTVLQSKNGVPSMVPIRSVR